MKTTIEVDITQVLAAHGARDKFFKIVENAKTITCKQRGWKKSETTATAIPTVNVVIENKSTDQEELIDLGF